MRTLRKATYDDLPIIMDMVHAAKAYMKRSGIDQWKEGGYPSIKDYTNDIEQGSSYVVEDESGIIAAAAIVFKHESDYDAVIGGSWRYDGEYGAIHRVVVKESLKGGNIGGFIVDNAVQMCREKGIKSLRCDTHRDNISMQRMLEKNGFVRCCELMILGATFHSIGFEKLL